MCARAALSKNFYFVSLKQKISFLVAISSLAMTTAIHGLSFDITCVFQVTTFLFLPFNSTCFVYSANLN